MAERRIRRVKKVETIFKARNGNTPDPAVLDHESMIYLGEYHKQNIRNEIQKMSTGPDPIIINVDATIGFCVGLKLTENWHFKSAELPAAAFWYRQAKKSHGKMNFDLDEMGTLTDAVSQSLEQIVNNNYESAFEMLTAANDYVKQEFGLSENRDENVRGLIEYAKEPIILNSFYADDLKRILRTDTDDKLLLQYILGQDYEHLDIDKNWSFISDLLTVDKLPLGRWPSQVKYYQSLMQQTAINVIQDKTPDKQDLRTVNGPPGTGKTTLLKDVFADMIVNQGIQMAKLKQPEDGFIKKGSAKIFSHPSTVFALAGNLQDTGAMVVSSNNSAVANITKDFPDKRAIQKGEEGVDQYQAELEEVDYFSELANEIIPNSDTWGLFSVSMGKKENIQQVKDVFNKKNPNGSGMTALKQALHQASFVDWNLAKKQFNQALKAVQTEKARVATDSNRIRKLGTEDLSTNEKDFLATDLATEHAELNETEELIASEEKLLALLPTKRFLFWRRETEEQREAKDHLVSLIRTKASLVQRNSNLEDKKSKLRAQQMHFQENSKEVERIQGDYRSEGSCLATPSYWNSNEVSQEVLPDNSYRLQDARSELFIAAIRLRKSFIGHSERQVKNAWDVFSNQEKLAFPKDQDLLTESFKIIQLLIPVMSSTLASVGRMFKNFGENSIENVFIDEAGQATPASAVGIIWRAKRVVALGDPAQIEPVVTTDELTLRSIAQKFQVDSEYLSPTNSVQQMADNGSYYGTFKHKGTDIEQRVGLPLWVHRRCISPMFDIANVISYEGRMVQGNHSKNRPRSRWINSVGNVTGRQFVKEDLVQLIKALHQMQKQNTSFEDIFIISPFKEVVEKIKDGLHSEFSNEKGTVGGISLQKDWYKGHVGTVHTFQGKEAKVVFFVVGTDATTEGAANWAFQTPNLLNVAVTRAKEEFYVIGDFERLSKKPNMRVAAEFLTMEN